MSRKSAGSKENGPLDQRYHKGAVTEDRRKEVFDIVMAMIPVCWIAIDYLALGYGDYKEFQPVVLITVEEDKLLVNEAQRVVDKIRDVFLRDNISHIDVEIMEGSRKIWGTTSSR
ncbi:hypothetical protein WAI453_000095 [Rhynchosporium graminicola]